MADYKPDLQVFAARDGTFDPEKSHHYRIRFRGEHRRIVDLTFDELRAALLDAHCDLDLIYLKSCAADVTFDALIERFPGIAADHSFQNLQERSGTIEKVSHRHRTPSEVEEELNLKEGKP